jgi:hypothetical protein
MKRGRFFFHLEDEKGQEYSVEEQRILIHNIGGEVYHLFVVLT